MPATERIVAVGPSAGGWEVRTAARSLWVPQSTMEAWLRRIGVSPTEVVAAGCTLEVNQAGEARGIGWGGGGAG